MLHLSISQSHVFLVNSRLGHFSAPRSREDPFSRSYGVILPSSLAMVHSYALGCSPRPPVSVYGTGPDCLAPYDFSREHAYPRYPLPRGGTVLSGLGENPYLP